MFFFFFYFIFKLTRHTNYAKGREDEGLLSNTWNCSPVLSPSYSSAESFSLTQRLPKRPDAAHSARWERRLVDLWCRQPVNDGIFCCASTTFARRSKEPHNTRWGHPGELRVVGRGFALCVCACDAEGLSRCLFIALANCLYGRFSMNDLLRGSAGSTAHAVR